MKRSILFGLLGLLWTINASSAVIKTVQAGAVDQTVTLKIINTTTGAPETAVAFNTSGIDLKYWRHGANSVVSITEATQTISGAHSDGGFVALGDGRYRLDLPDAAVASGATAVEVFGTVTGMIVIGGTVDLSPPANTVALAGTAQTGRDIGASVLLSSGTGTGQISFTSGIVGANAVQVSGDSAVADRLEAMLDGTCGSYPELGISRGVGCTAVAYTAGTPSLTLDSPAAFGDNTLNGATIMICGSTQGYCQPARALSNVGDVVTLEAALPVAATGTVTYTIFGTTVITAGDATEAKQDDIISDLTAVKSKTDNITFTKTGEVDANTQSINDAEIVGDGAGTPFNVGP